MLDYRRPDLLESESGSRVRVPVMEELQVQETNARVALGFQACPEQGEGRHKAIVLLIVLLRADAGAVSS